MDETSLQSLDEGVAQSTPKQATELTRQVDVVKGRMNELIEDGGAKATDIKTVANHTIDAFIDLPKEALPDADYNTIMNAYRAYEAYTSDANAASLVEVGKRALDNIDIAQLEQAGVLTQEQARTLEGLLGEIVGDDSKYTGDMVKLKTEEAVKIFLKGISASNISVQGANDANNWWKNVAKYSDPPYTPGGITLIVTLDETAKFVRVYDDINSSMKGPWFMSAEEVKGLTPEEIQVKYALPTLPQYIVDLELPAGTKIRVGEANSLYGFEGKGIQFDAMGQFLDGWSNPRPIE